MTVKKLIKMLEDMETIYDDAVIVVSDEDGKEKHIISLSGFWGEKRPHECRDPHIVSINIKGWEK